MAWGEADFECILPDFNKISFFQINQGAIIVVKGQLPAFTRQGGKVQDRLLLFMDMQVQSPGIVHVFIAENMVQVTVCIQQ